MPLAGRSVLLIIGGGIAAYKSLDLIRRLQDKGADVQCVLTEAATAFVTPLTVSALSHSKVRISLLDVNEESGAGHIHLARNASMIIVAPATADLIAKMALGLANDLASAILLAATCPVLIAPAMNPTMWYKPSVQRNFQQIQKDGVYHIGPEQGAMAERESGIGRMADVSTIIDKAKTLFSPLRMRLKGKRVLITAGPTYESIDPVRFIGNRSSGKQGFALAEAASNAGAEVTLISGPVSLNDPKGVEIIRVESAEEMLNAVKEHLPADIAIFAAAVSDWRVLHTQKNKIKKDGKAPPHFELMENPDILATIAHLKDNRPSLVVGFAAETDNVLDHARDKLKRKGCDFIVANDISPEHNVMGGDHNTVHIISEKGIDHWETSSKKKVSDKLIVLCADYLEQSYSL